MTHAAAVRGHLATLAIVAVPLLLALRFGGYHVRHAGWAVLGLVAWAVVLAARGRLGALRSPFGVGAMALAALVAWSAASIAWADSSRHDAWVEAVRALGHAAAFVVGGALLSRARAYAAYVVLLGGGIAVLALAVAARLATSDAPLRLFSAGRLDWPVGYAPGMAGLYLIGALLLLGASCRAQQRWGLEPSVGRVVESGLALAGAGACAALALLAQSRGTLPAVAAAALVALVVTPNRTAWLLRLGAIVAALALAWSRLAGPFRAQFELRQAPFTEGSDPDALLAAAESAAASAGVTVVVVAVALGLAGVALVGMTVWLEEQVEQAEDRIGVGLALPAAVLVVAVVGTLLLVGGGDEGTPRGWIASQWRGCVDPPEAEGDPGSASSYFANAGTGRCDYYAVALRSAADRPLLGLGAGNFRGEYVRERRTDEEPRVVHSLPLQLLAELGLVGLALGLATVAAVVVAAARFVRSGAARDAAFAGGVAALAYWLAHASIDWLWQLPAVSMPALVLAGGLAACVSAPQRRSPGAVAWPLAAGVLIAAVALVLPVTMADARLRAARDPVLQEEDPVAALQAAVDAQDFDPTWAEPAITAGSLHARAGRRDRAAASGRRAVRLEPRNWSVQYRASGLIGLDDTAEGLAAFQAARELNPRLPATVDPAQLSERESTPPDALQNPEA